MFNFRKRHPNTPIVQTPTWFKWGLLAFIALIIFSFVKKEEGKQSRIEKTVENIKGQLPDKADYTSVIPEEEKPVKQVGFQIKQVEEGNGQYLLCRQDITVEYQLYDEGKRLAKGQTQFNHFPQVHTHQLFPLTLGMSMNEVRRITMNEKASSKQWLSEQPEHYITHFDLKLVGADPDLSALFDDKRMGIKIFDEDLGKGDPARCGDKVSIEYKAYDGQGKIVKKGKTEFGIGTNEVFMGMEQGVIGMLPSAKRLLILPYLWQLHRPVNGEAIGGYPLEDTLPFAPSCKTQKEKNCPMIILEVTRTK